MKDFNFYSPTQVVFGRQSEEQVAALVKRWGGTKVLVHYGGGSARRSGLLDKMFRLLSEGGIEYVELGGVVPNPLLSKVKEGIALCRKEEHDGCGQSSDTVQNDLYGGLCLAVFHDSHPGQMIDGHCNNRDDLQRRSAEGTFFFQR